MSQGKKSLGRRTFLAGLVTGAGVIAALGGAPRKAKAKKPDEAVDPATAMILYRRTEEAERYYRTLHR
jgi:hypothetical protein